ncbi:hypothetical protein [Enterobacter asburiae]|uniref:hypothetical protein n=1 Tax=Enterobacter asburiae TaxID=61645 RepID=UPI003EE61273
MGTVTQSQQYLKSGPLSSSGGNSTLLLKMLRPCPLPVAPRPVMSKPPIAKLTKGTGVSGVSVIAGGSGYSVGNSLIINGGAFAVPCAVRVNAIDANGGVTAASIQCPGVYTAQPTAPANISGGTGKQARHSISPITQAWPVHCQAESPGHVLVISSAFGVIAQGMLSQDIKGTVSGMGHNASSNSTQMPHSLIFGWLVIIANMIFTSTISAFLTSQ